MNGTTGNDASDTNDGKVSSGAGIARPVERATTEPLSTRHSNPLIQERSRRGRRAIVMPESDVPSYGFDDALLRTGENAPRLPEVGELELVRHYTNLSRQNYAIDTTFYPLGSCTMKYNPKMNEDVAAMAGFADAHPLAPLESVQGNLELIYRLERALVDIAGFHAATLQPAAGAQGELTGILMIRAYHQLHGDTKRRRVLVPDSAHGTNPATCSMAGFEAVELPSDAEGNVDLEALRAECDETVAGLMITNPNTAGLFEQHILEVTRAVHDCGGLVYGDGANMNAILGVVRPGDLGIDVMHFNLHKTFSTPHGGGGPGAGPVAAGEILAPFLPGPRVVPAESRRAEPDRPKAEAGTAGPAAFTLETPAHSIGRMKSYFGNFGMFVRAYAYILRYGRSGIRHVAENAVLNANYLKHLVSDEFPARFSRSCMHEFVASGTGFGSVHTMDIAKRLIDYGYHPPTVYFPLIVKEALMIEPTESESRETLESFAGALKTIASEARENPEVLHNAPFTAALSRLDEVSAARRPVLCYRD
ncbi:MAG: aminomethyl-transferring glycine dehydrogenase subunit GcvPB [Spirochaetota bacterium]